MKSISAIIPAYNCESYLQRAVESLLATDYPDLEIVIVDDGSTDDTMSVATTLSRCEKRIQVVQHSDRKNHGASSTRNRGIQYSEGELVCFLDADDYVYSHRFGSSVTTLAEDHTVAGVYNSTRMEYPTPEAATEWPDRSELFGLSWPVPSHLLLSQLLKGAVWAMSAILVRRTLLNRTGLFHERLVTAEDCHLWFRMAAVGRIVAGDLVNPVSVYVRREGSLYQHSWRTRLNMLKAMAAFAHWAKRPDVSLENRQLARTAATDYALNSITTARRAGARQAARMLAFTALRQLPWLTAEPLFWKHAAHLMLSGFRRDPLACGEVPNAG